MSIVEAMAEAVDFKMPPIRQGTCVTWYDPTLAEARRVIAYVIKVAKTGRSLTLHVPSTGAVVEGARHMSDPKLQLSAEFRENGAWDYTDEWKATQQRLADLESSVRAIQDMLQPPPAVRKSPAKLNQE